MNLQLNYLPVLFIQLSLVPVNKFRIILNTLVSNGKSQKENDLENLIRN